MESMEKWNKIVEQYNKNKHSKESEIQTLWESIFSEVFGYSKILGYLDAQKSFAIGSNGTLKPDIILKKNDLPVCAVELKQETICLSDKIENQLFSYLKQTKISTGIIISDKIYLYAYEYVKDDSQQSKVTINFEKNNIDGELFVNLISSDAFNSKSISDYVNEKVNHLNNVKNIKDTLSKNLVLEALGQYLGKQYSAEEISEALESIEIVINDKKKQQSPSSIKVDVNSTNSPQIKQDVCVWNLDAQILIAGGKQSSVYLRRYLIENKYISSEVRTTLAKINIDTGKEKKRYWANPPVDYIYHTWLLVLNDNVNRKLHFFRIPANSMPEDKIRTRIKDNKTLLDIEIINQDSEFVCISSKIQYNKWFVETVDY